MAVQADITFDRVPEYGVERSGAVVATFEVPPPPWEPQQQWQQPQQQRRPPQPLPPPPRLVGFFTKRIERGGAAGPSASACAPAPASAAGASAAAASPAEDKKHLSFNTPRAASALLPVRAPPLPSDLNRGYPDGWAPTPHRASVSEVVLSARAAGVDPLDCDVVTFRSNLRPIFGCCVDPRKEWTVDAIVLEDSEGDTEGEEEGEEGPAPCEKRGRKETKKKTVFLEIVQHLEREEREGEGEGGRAPPPPSFQDQDRFFFWGFKFESLCFGASPAADDSPRVGRTEFSAVMVRELPAAPAPAAAPASAAAAAAESFSASAEGEGTRGTEAAPSSSPAAASSPDSSSDGSAPLKLLVVAEMDGFDEEIAASLAAEAAGTGEKEATTATATLPPTPPLSSLVELKTLKWPEPGRDWALFNLKAPTWWLQCFLG